MQVLFFKFLVFKSEKNNILSEKKIKLHFFTCF
jgi:hypothetical protein